MFEETKAKMSLGIGNKGQINELPSFIIGVGVFTLVLALVAIILGEFSEIAENNSIAANVSNTGARGMGQGAEFIPILIIIGVIVVVLGMIMRLRGQ